MDLKALKHKAALFFFTTLLVISMFCGRSVSTKAATNQENYSRWMATCSTMLSNMKKYHFRYGNSGTKHTYDGALKSKRRTNCALFVSWCLQEYGAISKGNTFYVKPSGKIHKSFGSWGSNVSIIRVYKTCTSVNLQPGDVCCWSDASHANIYVGKTAKGNRLWYDGGKVSTASNSPGSRYTNTQAHSYDYLNHRKISYIIRIKDVNQ